MTILVTAALVGCQAQAQAKPTAPQTAKIQRGNLTASLSAAGTVVAQSQVALMFQASGQVKEIDTKVGDKVKAGQVLAKLDATDLEMAVIKAQIALDTSKVQLQKRKKAQARRYRVRQSQPGERTGGVPGCTEQIRLE